MTSDPTLILTNLLAAFEAKNLDSVLGFFADDALVIDPHYPIPEMKGKPAILEGVRWAFGALDRPGFRVVHAFPSADGQRAAVEVETTHTFRGGMRVHFPQVFVAETRDGLITRLQAYPPYGPHGVGGLMLNATRLVRWLRSRVGDARARIPR